MRRSSKSSGKTPRNKVFVAFEVLLVSASEETGKKITADELKKIIKRFMSGTLKASEEAIYDGAVAACGVVARRCFVGQPPPLPPTPILDRFDRCVHYPS